MLRCVTTRWTLHEMSFLRLVHRCVIDDRVWVGKVNGNREPAMQDCVPKGTDCRGVLLGTDGRMCVLAGADVSLWFPTYPLLLLNQSSPTTMTAWESRNTLSRWIIRDRE